MQLLLHLPESLAERFKLAIPARQRSAFVAGLLERALPEEDDPLYHIALAVERDAALNAEMREWREGLVADGIRGDAAIGDGASVTVSAVTVGGMAATDMEYAREETDAAR